MGAPDRNEIPGKALHYAMTECISAMSALNMFPEPIPGDTDRYLSECDKWAAHSMEHLHATMEHLRLAEVHMNRERMKLYRVVRWFTRKGR